MFKYYIGIYFVVIEYRNSLKKIYYLDFVVVAIDAIVIEANDIRVNIRGVLSYSY